MATHLAVARELGLATVGLPISSDPIESLFGVAKQRSQGPIKDADRLAVYLPAFCGQRSQGDAARVRRAMAGSAGRAAAGAVSVGSALGAALTNRRTLSSTEGGPLATVAVAMVGIAIVAAFFPRVLAWPIALLAGWLGIAWAWKAWTLWRRRGSKEPVREAERPVAPPSGEPRA